MPATTTNNNADWWATMKAMGINKIQRTLSALPKKDSVIVQLHYYEGMTPPEVAYVMDTTPEHVTKVVDEFKKSLGLLIAEFNGAILHGGKDEPQ